MDYTYLKLSGGAVTVLGLDDDSQAVCVRQYRHPTGQGHAGVACRPR